MLVDNALRRAASVPLRVRNAFPFSRILRRRMSAIAGIIHFDGEPVARQDLERMSQALEPFGRDGARIVLGNGVGFVVRTALITPEDRLDRQPVVMAGQDRLLFDGRLDNRPDLIRKLGLSESEGRLLADSALAARAWERWERDCLIQLIGVFSLACWQVAKRQLILARSAPFGKPLCFHRNGPRLYFASAPHGLFALPCVPRALNEATLGDLLLGNSGAGETLFQSVETVQNAHWAVYRIDSAESHRYWTPDPGHHLHFKREEEAWEAFHPLFEEVVKSQLRAIHPVGVQMSGGLDSAAIAGQAARILASSGQILRGYTRVPAPGTLLRPDGMFYNDERSRVGQIARMHPNLHVQFVDAGDEPVLDGMALRFASGYGPPAAPTFSSGYQVLYRRVAADGVRVLLTGASGNFTFTYDGIARLRELMLHGRWFTLCRELRELHRFRGGVRDLIKFELLDSMVPDSLRSPFQRLRNRGQTPWSHYSVAAQSFAHSSGAQDRMRERINLKLYWQRLHSWGRRAWVFNRTGLGGADVLQAEHGLEMRDPSADRRLVEFCLALPDEIYLKNGIERRLARLGMANLIPEAVRLDPSRGRQDVDWAFRMRKDSAAITRALEELAGDPGVCKYLDIPAMQDMWRNFDSTDWRSAPLADVIRYTQGLMGGMAVGQFVRWFERRN